MFGGFLFLLLAILIYPETPGDYAALAASAYAFTAFAALVVLNLTKHSLASLFLISAPIATYLILTEVGLHTEFHVTDRLFLLVVSLVWLRYGFRVVAIARAHPSMIDPEPPIR